MKLKNIICILLVSLTIVSACDSRKKMTKKEEEKIFLDGCNIIMNETNWNNNIEYLSNSLNLLIYNENTYFVDDGKNFKIFGFENSIYKLNKYSSEKTIESYIDEQIKSYFSRITYYKQIIFNVLSNTDNYEILGGYKSNADFIYINIKNHFLIENNLLSEEVNGVEIQFIFHRKTKFSVDITFHNNHTLIYYHRFRFAVSYSKKELENEYRPNDYFEYK